jgi:predicted DNA binding CopG/RHH family protein
MKKIPKFKNEAEERAFWATADSRDYVDWSQAAMVRFPNLKPTLKTISLRLPGIMIEELKLLANKRDVPYQSLIKIFLSERLASELGTGVTVASQAKPAGYAAKRRK